VLLLGGSRVEEMVRNDSLAKGNALVLKLRVNHGGFNGLLDLGAQLLLAFHVFSHNLNFKGPV
jgi:hypothetical protein